MSSDFFEKPFNEDTLTKLQMYSDYLKKWIPVFVAAHRPFVNTVNIFDFFAGVGKDIRGVHGSPLLTIETLMDYEEHLKREDIQVNVYLNEYNSEYCERLDQNIDKLNFDRKNINVHILNFDFYSAFTKLRPRMENAANLLFLDQFGVKFIDEVFFKRLIQIRHTDILFFVSSSTFYRFPNENTIKDIIGIDPEVVRNTPATQIHNLVTNQYKSFIPPKVNYGIAPFSIKKGGNVYGLIFGSGHPLGMEKFLEVCWDKDQTSGEANFDIEGDAQRASSPYLFAEMNVPSKTDIFQSNLEDKIISGHLSNDMEIYFYMINNGFLSRHVTPVIEKLKAQGRIKLERPSFKCRTIMRKGRQPKQITIL